jgi:dTMP kinase
MKPDGVYFSLANKNNNMRKGIFIVLEGADGSGKSTHSHLLAGYLLSKGLEAVVTAEPTKGETGQKIRRVLKGEHEATPEELTELFTEDRREHVRGFILPNLENGKIVVCDRFYYSTIAYQSAQGVDEAWISELNRFVPEPDLVIVLEIDAREAEERMSGRHREVFEYAEFQEKVQAKLLELAKGGHSRLSKPGKGWKVIENDDKVEVVQSKIRKAVDSILQ